MDFEDSGIYHVGKWIYGFIAKNRNTERCTEENCGYTPPVIPPKEEELKLLQNYTLKDLKVYGITFGLAFLILIQIIVSYNSPLNRIVRNKIGFQNTAINQGIEKFSSKVERNSKIYTGITYHGVFMDYHFSEYNHLISVVYKDKNSNLEVWLPIMDKDGTPGDYIFGANWVKWSFRVNHNKINQSNMEKGIRDFTAFWAEKNNVDLNDAEFIIKLKKVETPKGWEKDFLKRQMDQPWTDIGIASWKDNKYYVNLPEVEKL